MPLTTCVVTIVLLLGANAAQCAVTINAVETGGNVVFTGSGSLNTGAWTLIVREPPLLPNEDFSRMNPSNPFALVGPTPSVDADFYVSPQNFVGPSDFGAGGESFASSGAGDLFGFRQTTGIAVPLNYVSGDPLSGSATYSGQSFASLGMDMGSYMWTWGSNSTADSLTLNVVPEPSTVLLLSLGLVGVGACTRRRS